MKIKLRFLNNPAEIVEVANEGGRAGVLVDQHGRYFVFTGDCVDGATWLAFEVAVAQITTATGSDK